MIRELISGAGIAIYAEIALVIFVLVFAAIVIRAALWPAAAVRRFSAMALQDDDDTVHRPSGCRLQDAPEPNRPPHTNGVPR